MPSLSFLPSPVPEIIDPVFAKTSQNARFLLSENERFGLVFVKTGSINSGTDAESRKYDRWKGTYSKPKSRLFSVHIFLLKFGPRRSVSRTIYRRNLFCLDKIYKFYIPRMAVFFNPHERCALHSVSKPQALLSSFVSTSA
jgi:hypothetical protein